MIYNCSIRLSCILLGCDNMDADYLNEFEQMNETTESVFDLGEHELLIVLNDGTNLTSWDDVDDFNDVLYISEDFFRTKNIYSMWEL